MEKHLNNLNSEGLKVGIIIHKGKTEYMTNHADGEDILNDQENIEKVTEFKYHGQTTHHKVTIKGKNLCQDKSSLELFWKKTRKIFNDPRQTTPHFTKKTSNGPVCLANIDLRLPNMVSQYRIDRQTENRSNANGKINAKSKATR